MKNIKINLFLKDQILVENVITCFGHVVEYSFEVIENNTSFVFTCSFVSQKGWMFCSIDHLTIMLHFDVAISNRSLGSTMSNIKTYYSLFFGCINIISSYFHLDLRALHICVSHIEPNTITSMISIDFLFFPFTTLKPLPFYALSPFTLQGVWKSITNILLVTWIANSNLKLNWKNLKWVVWIFI